MRLRHALALAAALCLNSALFAQPQGFCGNPVGPVQAPQDPVPPVCCNPCKDCQNSPPYVKTGAYTASADDLSVTGVAGPIRVTRRYESSRRVTGVFGIGWTLNVASPRLRYATYLLAAPSTVQNRADILYPDGGVFSFVENADGVTYSILPGRNERLVKNGDGTWDLVLPNHAGSYHFNTTGSLTQRVDEFGNLQVWSYDGQSRVTRVTDSASGRYVDVFYGGDGRVSAVRDNTGNQVQYGYNGSGVLSTVTDPAGRITRYSYATGRFVPLLNQVQDNWNRVIEAVTYDSADRVATYTENGETYTYTYNYQGDPNKIAKTYTLNTTGTPWVYTVGNYNLVGSRTAPTGGGTTTKQFDATANVQLATDAAGVKTYYTYNADGTVATVTQDYQGSSAVRYDYAYDPAFPGKVTSVTPKDPTTNAVNPYWQAWRYDYYQSGATGPGALFHVYRVRADGTTLDTVATYEYDSQGRITRQTNAASGATDYVYDGTGNLQTVTGPANNDLAQRPVTTYAYDSLGRVSSVTDPLSHQTAYTYDSLGRVLTVTLPKPSSGSPLNFVTTYSYDNYDAASGLVFTHVTDPNGKLTKLGYDQFGRLVKSIDAANAVTTYAYNKNILQSITDANNNVTSYQYDSLGRLTRTTSPDGAYETYAYRTDGLLQSRTPRVGATLTFGYDAFKRLTTKTYSGGGGSIAYTYQGQMLTQVVDTSLSPNETHTFSYDTSYRLATNAQASRGTVNYTYRPDDRVATMGITSGPTATYDYYQDLSLKTIDWSPQSGQFRYQYTRSGQYDNVTFPNGQVRQYGYDDQGRLLQLSNTLGATNLATYAYGYDLNNQTSTYTMLGQRTSQTATVPTQGFTGALTKYYYDTLYQLNRADYPAAAPFNGEIDSWTYDSIGNRLTNTVNGATQTYAYFKNAGNSLNSQRLQTDGASTYAYNAAGANTGITGGSSYTLGYDNEVRLTSISGSTVATYAYDYQGRRTSKTVGGVTATFLYDGVNPIAETVGGTPRYYLNGPGIDEPLAVYAGGAMTYLASDALGSVALENDPSATVTRSTIFDAWGGVKSETGTRASSFTYTGREVGEAGFHFYRARYYQPSIGRFQQEDPMGYKAGSMTFYGYVSGDPVLRSDPLGLYQLVQPGRCKGTITAAFEAITKSLPSPEKPPCDCEKYASEHGGDLRANASPTGVPVVMVRKLPPGVCGATDGNTIFINESCCEKPDMCKLGSLLLHELGHFWRQDKTDNEPPDFFQRCRLGCIQPGQYR